MHNMYNQWRWTPITAYCYSRRMVCGGCPEYESCAMGENAGASKKLYGLKNIKEAVLLTYANIGVKGLEKFLGKVENDTRDE